MELVPGDLPPVLDVEQANGYSTAVLKREIKKWLETVENYYHVKPIIYTNVDFYKQRLGADFDKYPLWVAHYYQQQQPHISRAWLFWQHNDEGRVNGILSKVDFNVFSGDSAGFTNLLVADGRENRSLMEECSNLSGSCFFMESGMDPEVRRYFRKIVNSFSLGLLWMALNVTAGIYFELAYTNGRPLIFTLLFYAALLLSLAWLLRYYYRTWKK